jgi:hypothetical protein
LLYKTLGAGAASNFSHNLMWHVIKQNWECKSQPVSIYKAVAALSSFFVTLYIYRSSFSIWNLGLLSIFILKNWRILIWPKYLIFFIDCLALCH